MKFSIPFVSLVAVTSALPTSTPNPLLPPTDLDTALLALVNTYIAVHQPHHAVVSLAGEEYFFEASILLPSDTRVAPERYDEKNYPPKKCDEHVCCAETRCWRISPPQVTVNGTVEVVRMAVPLNVRCERT